MFLRILKKDLKRKKTMNLILLIFVTLAAMFVASSVNNILTVTTALDDYFEMADVPDYWIAASESEEADRLNSFAEENGYGFRQIDMIQTDPKEITIDGNVFAYKNTTLLSSLNGAVVFNPDGSRLNEINDGEVYLGSFIFNDKNYHISKGSEITVKAGGKEKTFTVKGCVKDALYGSGMIGSTRFLISENDYEYFKSDGVREVYSVCINTDDSSYSEKYSALEINSVFNVTRSEIKLMYVMDTLIAAIILVVSLCLILISMVILHFTINFTMSEEYREIGVMKAIGIPDRSIRSLYIAKYLAISIVGAVIGFALSIPFENLLIKNVSENIIINNSGYYSLSAVCAGATAATVVGFCYFCTRKIKKLSPVDSVRNGENGERFNKKSVLRLSKSKLSATVFMSLNDVLSGLKRYISMLIIFTLGILLILIPVNAVNTLRSDKLIKWFNMAESDLVINEETLFSSSIDNKTILTEKLDNVRNTLDENNINADVFQEIMFRMNISFNGNKTSSLAFQGIGDVTADMYSYIKGTPPQNENEIAVSYIIADRIGADIGDEVEINTCEDIKKYTITAINQSMNNMGESIRFYHSAKLDYRYAAGSFGIQVKFRDNPTEKAMTERKDILRNACPNADILTSGEYISNKIGGVSDQLEGVKVLIIAVILCVNMLVSVLMIKSFITKERCEIAILKAIGFKNSSLVLWQALRIGIILLLSVIMSVLLSAPLSKLSLEPVFKMMGAYSVEFDINPLEIYVIYPLIVLAVTFASAVLSAVGIRKIKASDVSNIE